VAKEAGQVGARISPIAASLIACVRLYQATLSAFIGGHCRFQPTCSQYAIDALRAHGAWHGVRLAARRIARCHPWGGCGYDPVPQHGHHQGCNALSESE
jgi:hypothetical protein